MKLISYSSTYILNGLSNRAFEMLPDRLVEFLFDQRLKRSLSTPPALIYSSGKVGSTSILKSLQKQYKGVTLSKHHSFDPNDKVLRHLYNWSIVKGMPLKVISLVREPISQNVSIFFENLERITGTPYPNNVNFSIEQLKAMFLSRLNHERSLVWFDEELLPAFGIDVFSKLFPRNGICMYTNNNIELLIMRSELPDDEKAKAIANFLDLDCLQIERKNVGGEKYYAKAYADFKRKVKFSSDYIQKMINSKYFKHFYGEEKIDWVINKWSDG